jgi:RNA polymerase II-associated factor 1
LPLIPFDPKLLQYPHAVDRHYKYFDYSLLKDHQYELIHPDGDWGIGCNPFEMGYLEQQLKGAEKLVPRKELLDEKDQELLIDPVAKKDTAVGSVPWLRRTEYISTERNVYGRNLKAGVESKIGLSVMKEEKLQQLLDLSVDGQIQHINQSFEAANKANLATLKHPKKKDLEALEIFPIFPDFEYWSNPFFMTSFDSDPISDKMQVYFY